MNTLSHIEQDLKYNKWWETGPVQFLLNCKWNWFVTNNDIGILLYESDNIVYNDRCCKIEKLGNIYTMFISTIVCRDEVTNIKYIVLNSNQDSTLIHIDCVSDCSSEEDN